MAINSGDDNGAGPKAVDDIASVKVKHSQDDNGTNDGQDTDEEDDIPFAWQSFQQTATTDQLWKLSGPVAADDEPGIGPFVDPHDSYFLLDKQIFTRLRFAKQGVQEAYISLQTYNAHLTNRPCDVNFPFLNPSTGDAALPIRTETGSSVWIQPTAVGRGGNRASSRATPPLWSAVYATSVAAARQRHYSRRYVTVNGATLKLFLLPIGKLTDAELTAACQGFPADDFQILPKNSNPGFGTGLVFVC